MSAASKKLLRARHTAKTSCAPPVSLSRRSLITNHLICAARALLTYAHHIQARVSSVACAPAHFVQAAVRTDATDVDKVYVTDAIQKKGACALTSRAIKSCANNLGWIIKTNYKSYNVNHL